MFSIFFGDIFGFHQTHNNNNGSIVGIFVLKLIRRRRRGSHSQKSASLKLFMLDVCFGADARSFFLSFLLFAQHQYTFLSLLWCETRSEFLYFWWILRVKSGFLAKWKRTHTRSHSLTHSKSGRERYGPHRNDVYPGCRWNEQTFSFSFIFNFFSLFLL